MYLKTIKITISTALMLGQMNVFASTAVKTETAQCSDEIQFFCGKDMADAIRYTPLNGSVDCTVSKDINNTNTYNYYVSDKIVYRVVIDSKDICKLTEF